MVTKQTDHTPLPLELLFSKLDISVLLSTWPLLSHHTTTHSSCEVTRPFLDVRPTWGHDVIVERLIILRVLLTPVIHFTGIFLFI